MTRAFQLALLLLTVAAPLSAQEATSALRLRLTLDETPRLGRSAPPIRLPYATRDGIGPADQPFDLGQELGHVVVLFFYPGDFTPACTAEWRALKERTATLFPEGVVVAGISTDSLASHVRFASALELPYKLLSDADRTIIQRYGFADGPRARRGVVVVGADGVVRYLDPAFAALDPESYVQLAAAIRAATEHR
jgi:thioredoxin-dependent peroxiredoxin